MIYYWDSEPRLQHQANTSNKCCSFIVDLIKGAIKKDVKKREKTPILTSSIICQPYIQGCKSVKIFPTPEMTSQILPNCLSLIF